tara:strand:- start:2250 stop:2525 length:276 start_codon:yes stop_codon:yes gene_type:complete
MRIKLIFLILLLTSCGSLGEAGKALRNEKTRTTDEFLIEKRGPLSLPPKMGELPKPNSDKNVKRNKSTMESTNEKEKSAIENILLEEIRKN